MTTKAILAVASNCADPERVDEWEQWYREDHLADVLTVDHFVAAQLFRSAGRRPPLGSGSDDGVQFIAIYEIDTEDVDRAMDLLWQNDPRVEEAGRNPHLGVTILSHTFVAAGPRVTKSEALDRSPLPPLLDTPDR